MASEAEVDLVINATGALPEVERDLAQIIRTAEANADDVDVDAALNARDSLDQIQSNLNRVLQAAENGADDIDVIAVLDQQRTLTQLRSTLDAVITSVDEGAPEVDVNALLNQARSLRNVRQGLDRVVTQAQATVDDIDIDVDIDVDEDELRRLNLDLRALARGAGRAIGPIAGLAGGIAAVGVAAGGAIPLIAGVATAAAEIAPAAAVGVSGLLALQLATGTVRVAMLGVKEAVETAFDPEASPEDLAEAMKRLAPEAKAFVKELRSMRGELDDIRERVQNRFFEGFDDSLERLSETILPTVGSAMERTAVSLNRMARGAADAAVQLDERGVLGKALKSSTNSLQNLERVPGQVTNALGELAAAAGPSLERLSRAVSSRADDISEALTRAFESGALEDSIDDAISAIRQFGRVGGNIIGGLRNVFGGLTQDGRGLFDTLEQITEAFEDITASEGFQAALKELSEIASQLAKSALPILSKAIGIVGGIIEDIGPPIREIIELIGDRLSGILEDNQPLWDSLGDTIKSVSPIVKDILDLLFELAGLVLPLLEPVLKEVSRIFKALQPVISEIAKNIKGQLRPVFEALKEVLDEILPPLGDIVEELAPKLRDLIAEISPEVGKLAKEFGNALVELAPLVVKFLEFQLFLIEKAGPAIKLIVQIIAGIFIGVFRSLSFILREVVAPAFRIVQKILEGDFSGALKSTQTLTLNFAQRARDAFNGLKDAGGRAFSSLAQSVARNGAEMRGKFLDAVNQLVANAITQIRRLPGNIRDAMGNVQNLLVSAGANIIRGLINGMLSQLGRLRRIAADIASVVSGAVKNILQISSPSRVFIEIGQDTVAGFVQGLNSSLPQLQVAARGVGMTVPDQVRQEARRFDLSLPRTAGELPTVLVQIGNERLDSRIDYRARQIQERRERTLSQGVRR